MLMRAALMVYARALLIILIAASVAGVVLHVMFWSWIVTIFAPEEPAAPVAVKMESATPSTEVVTIKSIVLPSCINKPTASSSKLAVLRIDDVQAYAWGETTRKMIADAHERNAPLTLGIIPKGFSDDVVLSAYLRDRACNLEFALHGWNHQMQDDGVTPEFVGLDEAQAEARLQWGIHELRKAGIESLQTWIPPQNEHSVGTAAAAAELGFTRLSTEGDGVWDYDATSYVYGVDQQLLEPEVVVADCEAQIAEDGKCIIMLHPQNYANGLDHDEQVYNDYYIALIDQLADAGYTFARFADLDTAQ